MNHRDHVGLLREGVLGGGKIWADLGSGEGAFTLALADLLGPTGRIHTVDRDGRALRVQVRALRDGFPKVGVTPLVADFAKPLALPPLDGIVMANSLHFERDKLAVLRLVRSHLAGLGCVDPVAQARRLAEERLLLESDCLRKLKDPVRRGIFAAVLRPVDVGLDGDQRGVGLRRPAGFQGIAIPDCEE
jgi:hypothetical protein